MKINKIERHKTFIRKGKKVVSAELFEVILKEVTPTELESLAKKTKLYTPSKSTGIIF